MIGAVCQESERAQEHNGKKDEKYGPYRATGKGVDGREDAGASKEGAEDGQAEGNDDKRKVPDFKHAAAFLHLHGVKKSCRRKPRHKGRIFHRVPGPVAAPTEDVIRPVGANKVAHGQEKPGGQGPAAGGDNPGLIKLAPDQGCHSKGVGNGKADKAGVKQRRVGHHIRVLKQRV